jgi:hypothetical protein
LEESAHLGNRGLKWLRFPSRFFLGIGHRGRIWLCRCYWAWFRLRNIVLLVPAVERGCLVLQEVRSLPRIRCC